MRAALAAGAPDLSLGEEDVSLLYLAGGIVTLALLVYLFVALLRPDLF